MARGSEENTEGSEICRDGIIDACSYHRTCLLRKRWEVVPAVTSWHNVFV
jgi:hypothetical protein